MKGKFIVDALAVILGLVDVIGHLPNICFLYESKKFEYSSIEDSTYVHSLTKNEAIFPEHMFKCPPKLTLAPLFHTKRKFKRMKVVRWITCIENYCSVYGSSYCFLTFYVKLKINKYLQQWPIL